MEGWRRRERAAIMRGSEGGGRGGRWSRVSNVVVSSSGLIGRTKSAFHTISATSGDVAEDTGRLAWPK